MHGRLHGKIALIVEGDNEIAAATAVRFAREGARVALCGRNGTKLEETATAVADAGGTAYVLHADPDREAQVVAVIDEAVNRLGTLDVLVCCTLESGAGASVAEPAGKKALLAMAARGGGAIVIVAPPASAAAAARPFDGGRASLEGLIRRLAVDGGVHSVRTNLVVPGLVGTEDFLGGFAEPAATKVAQDTVPLHRFGRPDEVAAAIAFLSSDDAAYITGVSVIVDGGRAASSHMSELTEL